MSRRAMPTIRARRYLPGVEAFEPRLVPSGVGGDPGQYPLPSPTTDNTVLVKFASEDAERSALTSLAGYVSGRIENGPSTVVLGRGVEPAAAVAMLSARTDVLYAEENVVLRSEAVATPNDPYFSSQWGLSNSNDVDVDAVEAWSAAAAGPTIVVAVIDSGIDLSHPDLVGKIWTNTAEVAGNRRDDDRDGYIDDVYGWNFVNNTANVQDDNGHGSHVSGVIAASTNNGVGIAGVNPNVKIMPLKFLDSRGDGAIANAVKAIYFAVAHNARIINASWGGGDYSRALQDAIAYAASRDVLFVTAAGNESANNNVTKSYPASIRTSNILSVAAVDRNGDLADFSNYGSRTVDVAAPGVDIQSTINRGRYASYSGTSMAAPYVVGVASLIMAARPATTAAQVVALIRATVKPLPQLDGLLIAPGIVSAARALGIDTGKALGRPTTGTMTEDQLRARILTSDEFAIRSGRTNEGFVAALYRSLLGRDLDPIGRDFWVGQLLSGRSMADVVAGIQGAPEAAVTKVARWFRSDLGRTTDLETLKNDPGIKSWATLLTAGGTDASLEAGILSSDEYYARAGGTLDALIGQLYRNVMGREGSAAERAASRTKFLAASSRFEAIMAFLNDPEVKKVKVARWFQSDLGRGSTLATLTADPGVAEWAAMMADG